MNFQLYIQICVSIETCEYLTYSTYLTYFTLPQVLFALHLLIYIFSTPYVHIKVHTYIEPLPTHSLTHIHFSQQIQSLPLLTRKLPLTHQRLNNTHSVAYLITSHRYKYTAKKLRIVESCHFNSHGSLLGRTVAD